MAGGEDIILHVFIPLFYTGTAHTHCSKMVFDSPASKTETLTILLTEKTRIELDGKILLKIRNKGFTVLQTHTQTYRKRKGKNTGHST